LPMIVDSTPYPIFPNVLKRISACLPRPISKQQKVKHNKPC